MISYMEKFRGKNTLKIKKIKKKNPGLIADQSSETDHASSANMEGERKSASVGAGGGRQ